MGECLVNTENILVRESDLELSQTLCASIKDSDIRNRAVANVLAAKIGSYYFDKDTFQVDVETGLHNLCKSLTDVDISDLYVNNSYVDVRLYFTPEELGVPVIHFEHGITPDVYMFIKVSQDLTKAEVVGFLRPINVDTSNEKQGYYVVNESSLVSFYDIEKQLELKLDTYVVSDEELYNYTDNYTESKYETIKKLVKSKSSRVKLAKILAAEEKFKSVEIQEHAVIEEAEILEQNQEELNNQIIEDENSTPTQDDIIEENDLDSLFEVENTMEPQEKESQNDEDLIQALEFSTETTPNNDELLGQGDENDNSEQIDSLFNPDENSQEQSAVPQKKNNAAGCAIATIIVIVLLCASIGGGIYYVYKNFVGKIADLPEAPNTVTDTQTVDFDAQEPNTPDTDSPIQDTQPVAQKNEAMPVETVETKQTPTKTEIGNSVAIPAIEHNLDASVLVSNLRIDWEVPAAYASNVTAKRYLMKLGKVIQMRLKTELMLLSKPPLTNKITVELAFDTSTGKYVIVGMPNPSGEASVDKIIKETVQKVLSLNLSVNTEGIGKLQGNPILIIHL